MPTKANRLMFRSADLTNGLKIEHSKSLKFAGISTQKIYHTPTLNMLHRRMPEKKVNIGTGSLDDHL